MVLTLYPQLFSVLGGVWLDNCQNLCNFVMVWGNFDDNFTRLVMHLYIIIGLSLNGRWLVGSGVPLTFHSTSHVSVTPLHRHRPVVDLFPRKTAVHLPSSHFTLIFQFSHISNLFSLLALLYFMDGYYTSVWQLVQIEHSELAIFAFLAGRGSRSNCIYLLIMLVYQLIIDCVLLCLFVMQNKISFLLHLPMNSDAWYNKDNQKTRSSSRFWTLLSDTDYILTFSLGLSVPTLRRFCRLRSMIWYDDDMIAMNHCVVVYRHTAVWELCCCPAVVVVSAILSTGTGSSHKPFYTMSTNY